METGSYHVRRCEVQDDCNRKRRWPRRKDCAGRWYDVLRPRHSQGIGRPGGDGANPEKLFALGYSACFLSATRTASARTKIKRPEGSTVTATIGIGPRSEGGFCITAELDVFLPNLPEAEAKKLVEATHEICPYSNAIKASVDVKITTRS
jgi:lipoyl-dependent peroxiredoxin